MGVERLLADPAFPKGVPLARLVDPGMVAAMSESVIAHVLDWHRHHYVYRDQQEARRWHRLKQYLASDRTIGFLGLGELGSDAAHKLRALGFNIVGWSRRPKKLEGVTCLTELDAVLENSDVVVCLLPLTPKTQHILNARTLRKIREEGYSLYLLVDCKRDLSELEPLTFTTAPRLTSGEPTFQIDIRDLSFLRSIGIDPTRRLRRRRVT